MKNPSSVRYYLLTGAATTALLCAAPSFAGTSASAAIISDWHISPVTDNQNRQPYCALSARFDNGLILTNTRNRDRKGSLAVEFPNVKFQADQMYRIDLKIGEDGKLSRSYAAKAVKEDMIVVKIGDDKDLFDALDNGENITVMLEKGKAVFPLTGHKKSFYELDYCVKALPVVPTAIADEAPVAQKPDLTTEPSVPVEKSVYSKKVAPPTLEEKFKNDREKRVAASLKLKPIPVDETAPVKHESATPVTTAATVPEKTPAVLKSGYTSPKKRLYTPETPKEDISEEQRAASLKSTLEKARAKALAMAAGKTPEEAEAEVSEKPVQIASAETKPVATEKTEEPVPAPVAPEAAPATETAVEVQPAPPSVIETAEIKQPEPVKEPVKVPPVAFNTAAETPVAPVIAPTVSAPAVPDKQEDIIVPPVAPTPVIEKVSAPAVPAITEKAPVKEETFVQPAPQTQPVQAAIAPVLPPPVIHTVDFSSLPPKTFPVSSWETELVTNSSEKPYCILSSSFDNGVKLFLSRSSDGLSTMGIDFGTDLLEQGRSYSTTPTVENIYEKTFTAKAESANLLVVQLGKQDELFRAIQANGTFVVSIPGAVINFDTSSAIHSAEAFDSCLTKIDTALEASQIAQTSQPAVVTEVVTSPVPAVPAAAPTGTDKYRAPYVRTKQPDQTAANVPAADASVKAPATDTEPAVNTQASAPAPVASAKTAEDVPLQEPAPVIIDEPVVPSPTTAPEAQVTKITEVSSAPTSLTEKPVAEEPVKVPPVTAEQQPAETETVIPEQHIAEESAVEQAEPAVKPEKESDPAIDALNSLVERNRAEFEENLRKNSTPKNTARMQPQLRKFAPAGEGEPVSYSRVSAPKTSDVIKSYRTSGDKDFVGKATADIALIDVPASPELNTSAAFSGKTAFSGKDVYPLREIIKASGISANVRATSAAKIAYEWLDDATGVKGELMIIPDVNSADNTDYLLDLQDTDASSCKGNFTFELGAGNVYKTGSVMTADSICTDPLNASSSAYLLHYDGKALYRWRFSGEIPTALMIERNRISATINADAKSSR